MSYARDRRNAYGNSDKAARKVIPLRKVKAQRAARHAADQALRGLPMLDDARQDLIENGIRTDVERVGGWRKASDQSLADHIAEQRSRRERRVGRKTSPKPA